MSYDTPNRVPIRKVLLVGSPYSGFLLEDAGFRPGGTPNRPAAPGEGDAPSFDLVRQGTEAKAALRKGAYDMVIADQALPETSGSELVSELRRKFPQVPALVFTGDTALGGSHRQEDGIVDAQTFIYSGAPSFWRALVKLQEDEFNAPHLLDSGAAMGILLVEDEPNFYSHFLPRLYERIRESAIELLPEHKRPTSLWGVSLNRPLVLLRRTFEEACETILRYRGKLMALITDLCFPVAGELSDDAGLRLLYRARAVLGHLPAVVTSRDRDHREAVLEARAKFLWKDSPRLLSQLDSFLTDYCGFGPFVFRWPAGEQYGMARSLRELRDLIADVPDVVFEHHALHHDFITWLAVHGHPQLASKTSALSIAEPNLRLKVLESIDAKLANE